MGDIVKVGWSGGKDSTASVLLHLEQGDKVKAVCYVPMFTKDIPLITKEHYDFIVNTAERLRKMGAEVHIISGETYWDYVTKITTRGKYQGKMRGFPCVIAGKCGFQRDSKVKAVSNFNVGDYDYLDIGIAYDETERHSQLTAEKRSILVRKKSPKIWQGKCALILVCIHRTTISQREMVVCYAPTQKNRKGYNGIKIIPKHTI